MVCMTTVSISELKANLSRYLQEVRRGGEVQVTDRGVPVARLIALPPPEPGRDSKCRERLIRGGVLRPGHGDSAAILEQPPLELPVSIAEALAEERAEHL
jgi:prevent-host-death family protein